MYSPSFKTGSFDSIKDYILKIGLVISAILVLAIIGFFLLRTGGESRAKYCKDAGFDGSTGFLGTGSCKTEPDFTYEQITIVAGNTANVPAPSITTKMSKYLKNSLENDTVIDVASATPSTTSIAKVNEKNTGKLEKKMNEIEKSITTPPTEDGAQYLEAIINAGLSIKSKSSANKNSKSLIIVIGSGLSDGGLLDFSKGNLLSEDPENIKNNLVNNGYIKKDELSDIKILWSSIGVATYPQSRLDNREINKLKAIYRTILEYQGAKLDDYDDENMVGQKNTINNNNHTVKPTPTQNYSIDYIIDEESKLSFNPDEATFKEGDAVAQSEINNVIANAKTGSKVTIDGYVGKRTCSDTTPDLDLAMRRIEKVKSLLIAGGISSNNISTGELGFGKHNECPNGVMDEIIRTKNRVVIIHLQ